MHNVLTIFATDRIGNALPDVRIRVLSDNQEIGSGTTRGQNKPFVLQIPSAYEAMTIEASYRGAIKTATIPDKTTNYEFQFDVDSVQPDTKIPPWFPIAGYISGILTLLFFMALIIVGVVLGRPFPADYKFIIVIVMAFGLALAVSFIGGSAAAGGKIPFFKDSPVQFAVSGGIATFVIVLLIGWKVFLK